jgi:CheY-like chemotaxis protein
MNVLLFSANNLLSLVNDILDYNKIEAGKINLEKIPIDIPFIAMNIVNGLKEVAAEKRIDLSLDIDEELQDTLIGDPTRLGQVLNNLLQNALKFTNVGSVNISLKVVHKTSETLTLTISVKDTGIGISEDKQKLIFERFTQADSSTSRSYGGTGLGLAICKNILELQGTKLQLKSTPGKGSTFYFTQTFLISKEEMSNKREGLSITDKDRILLQGSSILLVEDNAFNIMVAQKMLENLGINIDVANDGKEAIDRFNPNKHELILMDLNMSVMDGYEATSILRKRGETIPIIALTASMPGDVKEEIKAAGLTDIVLKPFNPDDLYSVILKYLKKSSS